MARRSGRRPGAPDTREAILIAAREAFADKGYDGASIRTIAASAGVDPALLHHYSGAKDKLFLASMNVPFDLDERVDAILATPRDDVGAHMVRLILDVWETPAGTAAVAVLRSTVSNEWTAHLMSEFLLTQALRRVIAELDLDEKQAPTRLGLVLSHIIGLAMTRYVFKIHPIAAATPEQLAAAVGPTMQRYLTGDLTDVFGPQENGDESSAPRPAETNSRS